MESIRFVVFLSLHIFQRLLECTTCTNIRMQKSYDLSENGMLEEEHVPQTFEGFDHDNNTNNATTAINPSTNSTFAVSIRQWPAIGQASGQRTSTKRSYYEPFIVISCQVRRAIGISHIGTGTQSDISVPETQHCFRTIEPTHKPTPTPTPTCRSCLRLWFVRTCGSVEVDT